VARVAGVVQERVLMASISRAKNGHRAIQFIGSDSHRKTIRLGKVSVRQAESIKVRVEDLAAAAITGHAPDSETARWVQRLDSALHDKLSRVRLVPERAKAVLGEFLDRYFQKRIDVKPATKTVWRQTRRNLIEHFGADKPLRQITRADADEWRLSLIAQDLADSTIGKRCKFAKQFLADAVKQELIESNPFAELKGTSAANPKRFYFVTRAEAERVIDACPDVQWRLIFALSRYGGLRCPSEHLALKWSDVDWANGRLTVTSSKTEHHGKGTRVIPIFPELLPHFEDAFDLADEGTEFVITRYRETNANLRTQLLRIIARAGLKPWPKLFQNLRSTRETELAEDFPIHVVCQWIGNTQAIAEGKTAYVQWCAGCHLDDGTGRIGSNLVDDEYRYQRTNTDVGLFEVIYAGATGAMQAFGDRVSQDDILKIIAYMKTLE